MEVYGKEIQVSELINVGDFIKEWDDSAKSCCQKVAEGTNETSVLAKRMKTNEKTIEELTAVCSIESLLTGKEPKKQYLLKEIPEDVDLNCVKFQKLELEMRKKSASYRNGVARNLKNSMCEDVNNSDLSAEMKPVVESSIPIPNVTLSICVHKPYIPGARVKLMHEDTFLVLGSQKLTELRDVIKCVNDSTIAADLSENPDATGHKKAGDIFKSGFFFFEGTFYDDLRDPLNIRYSNEIIEWSSQPAHGQKSYIAKKMEDTRFSDLTIRLGQPYVYTHQGNCEHILIICDVRLLHSSDPQDLKRYPYHVTHKRIRRTICRACMSSTAKWMIEGSDLTPDNPSFLCNVCHKMLHYDVNNNKITDFVAYKFFDNACK